MTTPVQLSTMDMARFVTDGYLRFEGVVPQSINEAVLDELKSIGSTRPSQPHALRPESGTTLSDCFPSDSAVAAYLNVPEIAGAISSLVGNNPVFDHAFVHHLAAGSDGKQQLHADAAIDSSDPSFDIQLFYFPHEVHPGGGGTRFVPGTHLRRVHENSVGRYQHLAGEKFHEGPAGTVLIFHSGLWHAGQANPSETDRWMYKIRLNPTEPQVRLWDMSDYDQVRGADTDHIFATTQPRPTIASELRRVQRWSWNGESRLEQMERVRLWRYLSGDPTFDVDWYHTRIEQRADLLDRSNP